MFGSSGALDILSIYSVFIGISPHHRSKRIMSVLKDCMVLGRLNVSSSIYCLDHRKALKGSEVLLFSLLLY